MTTCLCDEADQACFVDQTSAAGVREVPGESQSICQTALTIAAEGGKADIAKPIFGMGSGIFEIAVAFRGDAFRVIYAVQIGDDLWVVHAFQRKSTRGIKTPQREIELAKERIKRLKEMIQ